MRLILMDDSSGILDINRFKGILIKMIKDAHSKFDDYSISPKIRQTLLHWGYELTKNNVNEKKMTLFF